MSIRQRLEANMRKNRRERPRSFAVGVVAVTIGIAGLVGCVVRYLFSTPGW
jgi:hypothetical protein